MQQRSIAEAVDMYLLSSPLSSFPSPVKCHVGFRHRLKLSAASTWQAESHAEIVGVKTSLVIHAASPA